MTSEQRNLLIGIAVLALIAGGVYFYNRSEPAAILEEVSEEMDEVIIEDTESTDEGEREQAGDGKIENTDEAAQAQAELLAKFNLALSNGHKEFSKGNYALALKYYEEALRYKKADVAYAGMLNVYSAQENWVKAEEAVNNALALNSRNNEYWKWKLTLLDERTDATFAELKAIYDDGLKKVDARTKINLVTHFANIAEANEEINEAISLWQYAKTLNPEKAAIYQAEIDRFRD